MVAYLDEGGARYLVKKVLDRIQPVGSLYFSTNSTSPASLFGGTWERYAQGRVMVSASDTDTDFTVGKTGGEKTHTLTVDELASHSHDISVAEGTNSAYDGKVKAGRRNDSFVNIAHTKSAGGNRPHNNLQPYVAVYIWRRTA